MIAPGGGGSKKVLYELAVMASKETESAFQRVKAQAKSVDDTLRKGAQQAEQNDRKMADNVIRNRVKMLDRIRRFEEQKAKEAEKSARAQVRAAEKAAREETRAREKAAREAAKMARDQERSQQRLAREQASLQAKAAREAERASRQQELAQKRLASNVTTTAAASEAANIQAMETSRELLGSVTQLGRAYALMGLSSEEDIGKAVRAFAKVEAAVQGIQGALGTVAGLAKLWRDVRKAADAAAAAQAAAAAISVAGGGGAGRRGASRAGGMAADAAAGAAGGALASGVGIKALLVGLGKAGAAAGLVAAKFAAIAAAGLAVGELFSRIATLGKTGSVTEFFGWMSDSADAKKQGEKAGRMAGRLTPSQDEEDYAANSSAEESSRSAVRDIVMSMKVAAARAANGGDGTEADIAGAVATRHDFRQRLASARVQQGRLQSELETDPTRTGIQTDIGKNAREMEAALRGVVETEQELIELSRKKAEEEIRGVQEVIEGLERQRDLQKSVVEREQQRLETAEDRLGAMDAMERARVVEAHNKLKSGASLSADETKTLQSVGLFDKELRESNRQNISDSGLDAVLGGQRKKISEEQSKLQNIEVQIKEQIEAKVTIEGKAETLAKELAAQLQPVFAQLAQAVKDQMEHEEHRRRTNTTNQRTQQQVAGG